MIFVLRIIAVLVALFAASARAEQRGLDSFGFPEGTVLLRGNYALAFDGGRRCARWTLEYLDADVVGRGHERDAGFVTDDQLLPFLRVSRADYTDAGDDKGHLANSANYGHAEAQRATFVFSNCAPQAKGLNRGPWRLIEKHHQTLARQGFRVWILTAPLWLPDDSGAVRYQVSQAHRLARPTHWGKAALLMPPGKSAPTSAEAWIYPNQEPAAGDTFAKHQVSVDEFEYQTGLDFVPKLERKLQDQLEAQSPTRSMP